MDSIDIARPNASGGAQAVSRAASLLRLVASGRDGGMPLSTIAKLSGLARPTAHRLLSALAREGLIEQKPRSRRYAIGPQVQLLALARSPPPPLSDAAAAQLGEAAATIGDTLFLTVRAGLDTVCVARRLGAFPIQVLVLDVGDRRPIGMSSAGIALLAGLPDGEAQAILSANETRLKAHGAPFEQARQETEEARRLGYALRVPGLVPGTRALSVAIRALEGGPVAALTVAGVSRRLAGHRLETVIPILARQAAILERSFATGG